MTRYEEAGHQARKRLLAGRAAIVRAMAAVAVAGCGGSSAPANPQADAASGQIAATVTTVYRDLINGNSSGVCNQLTPGLAQTVAQSFGGQSCADAVQAARALATQSQLQAARKAKAANVQVNGDHATTQLQNASGTLHLTQVGGRWLVSGGNVNF